MQHDQHFKEYQECRREWMYHTVCMPWDDWLEIMCSSEYKVWVLT